MGKELMGRRGRTSNHLIEIDEYLFEFILLLAYNTHGGSKGGHLLVVMFIEQSHAC